MMSAFFHPKDDLVVSASLDQTIRVWDISGLRKKSAAGSGQGSSSDERMGPLSGLPGSHQDLFGNIDCVVKFVLEGHSRGVNYASFHPTLPLIISGGDDRLIKLWRMNDGKAWEVDTCRGHYNNITSVLFNPNQDIIISAAEDKSIRVWDMSKRTALQTFRREGEKFWTLCCHPKMNLYAAGHDTGFIVFKLERERPAFDIFQDSLYYVKEKTIRQFTFQTAKDVVVAHIKRGQIGQSPPPKLLSYNPAENCAIVSTGKDECEFEVYPLARGDTRPTDGEPRRGPGAAAVYVARNRFIVAEKDKVYIKDLQNQNVTEIIPETIAGKAFKPIGVHTAIGKSIIITGSSCVILYDIESSSTTFQISTSGVRYVMWSADKSYVALVSKHNITLCDKNLKQLCQVHEVVKIKGGAWDPLGIFVFTNSSQIKYCLLDGDTGIIKTIDEPCYIVRVNGNLIHVLTRQGAVQVIPFDPTEYKFKLALISRNYDQVYYMIQNSSLVGQAIIGYLRKKGYPEIALQFVKDPKTRFDLALECGDIPIALEMAKAINEDTHWERLGQEASRQGNAETMEYVYQKTKNFDKLSFFYAITGNKLKLEKMLKIAIQRNDLESRYQNTLLMGDVHDQVNSLMEAGQIQLAYLTAQTYGMKDEAERILKIAGATVPAMIDIPKLTRAPLCIRPDSSNWPIIGSTPNIASETNDRAIEEPKESPVLKEADLVAGGDWGDDLEVPADPLKSSSSAFENLEIEDDGWAAGENLVIEEPVIEKYEPPIPGIPIRDTFLASNIAADHIAAGSFGTAMQKLKSQGGIVNFEPLRKYFLAIHSSAFTRVQILPQVKAALAPLYREETIDSSRPLPMICYKLDNLITSVQETYPLMTAGKFAEAMVSFRDILHQSIFVIESDPQSKQEVTFIDKIKELVKICREYLVGLATEQARRELGANDPKRSVELGCYFTRCELQPIHLQFALKAAMVQAFKLRNFGTAVDLANKLIAMNPAQSFLDTVRKSNSGTESSSAWNENQVQCI